MTQQVGVEGQAVDVRQEDDGIGKDNENVADVQNEAAQAVNYSLVQASQMTESDYANMMAAQQIPPYPTGMLATVAQPTSYTMSTQPTGWMMDGMGTPAAQIPPASAVMGGAHMQRALTLGYGSQTTTFYQMPTYSQYGVGFLVGNSWEGEEVDENTPPGKHGTVIVTPDHRQFHILASISDSRVGQLHLLNTGDTDPGQSLKVIQNTIPNHYRSAVQYIHKMFVCEFADKKFSVQACEPNAPKFYGGTSTLAWTTALRFYCPQRTQCRLSGPLYFGFAIPAVQELCPGLKYVARKSGNRSSMMSRAEAQYAEQMQPMEGEEGNVGMQPGGPVRVPQEGIPEGVTGPEGDVVNAAANAASLQAGAQVAAQVAAQQQLGEEQMRLAMQQAAQVEAARNVQNSYGPSDMGAVLNGEDPLEDEQNKKRSK